MTYRLTCLSPLLVGDGRMLSPIDYMVWRDQVNVLDQERIFRLLARGPRLENYLTQIKKADKLDFASWGGFAQNYADRRIPFEHASSTAVWERAHAEDLHIPTFSAGLQGRYLPASALKGALRTGYLFSRVRESNLKEVADRMEGERPPRRPAEELEDTVIGAGGSDRLRVLETADSAPAATTGFRVYLLRVATLVSRGNQLHLGWQQNPRGAADGSRPEQGTPRFAEMAAPGTVFNGQWKEREYLTQPEVVRALRWREPLRARQILQAANDYAGQILQLHRQYAEQTGLTAVAQHVEQLDAHLAAARNAGDRCLLNIGWGGGLLGKAAALTTGADPYRQILRALPYYQRAIQSGLPFPKTRHIIFLQNQPAALPGWAELTLEGA